jgi:hypothetical protein
VKQTKHVGLSSNAFGFYSEGIRFESPVWPTLLTEIYFLTYSVCLDKSRDSALNYVTTPSFQILSNSLFITALYFDCTRSELSRESLNKPRIYKRNAQEGEILCAMVTSPGSYKYCWSEFLEMLGNNVCAYTRVTLRKEGAPCMLSIHDSV